VELFEESGKDKNGNSFYDTFGEHVLLQVKGCKVMEASRFRVTDRINVELVDPKGSKVKSLEENVIDAFQFQMETSELVTVQRMGAAVPVLLTLVDVSARRVYFVCLNDYIDKIISPFDELYSEQKTKVIHVPVNNEIKATDDGLLPFRLYGKRAKLMAAFSKFKYQHHQLEQTDNDQLLQQAEYFARVLLRYDFWNSCDWWEPIALYYKSLVLFSKTGSPGLMTENQQDRLYERKEAPQWSDGWSGNSEYTLDQIRSFQEIRLLWDHLENIGNIYEEICREWFLPTPIGLIT